ncbi:MAG: FtsQ-type POTRA domain-containing protein [Rhizonema sp. NSF051]|nr:FtsQ-type POTRA domain-containing protein [Rhizonema sp. NSF051]
MAGIVSVSRTDIEGRRDKLRKKRQMKVIQAIWQTIAVSSLAGGLLWVTIQPIWVLKDPEDIVITGNQLLSEQAIQSLLVLSYPQSLWRIEPSRIAQSLVKQPTIAHATVSRRLFPPGLIVQVKERVPVAISLTRGAQQKKVSTGLLDASGVWMPLEKYTSLNPNVILPSLKVIGFPDKYCLYWTSLYQAVSQSSVKVMEIDCQDPTNVILNTELGRVHIGTPSVQIAEKIKVLAQMRPLPAQLNPNQIEYIDLKNPETPLVQMHQKKPPAISKTSS